jgi:hypothetical protein
MITNKADDRQVVIHLRRVAAGEGEHEKYGLKIVDAATGTLIEEVIPDGDKGAPVLLLKYGKIDNRLMDDVTSMVNEIPLAKLRAIYTQTEQAHQMAVEIVSGAKDPENLDEAENGKLAGVMKTLGNDILCIVSRRNKCSDPDDAGDLDETRLDAMRSIVADIVMNMINGASESDAGSIALTVFNDLRKIEAAGGVMKANPGLAALVMLAMAAGVPLDEIKKGFDEAVNTGVPLDEIKKDFVEAVNESK